MHYVSWDTKIKQNTSRENEPRRWLDLKTLSCLYFKWGWSYWLSTWKKINVHKTNSHNTQTLTQNGSEPKHQTENYKLLELNIKRKIFAMLALVKLS